MAYGCLRVRNMFAAAVVPAAALLLFIHYATVYAQAALLVNCDKVKCARAFTLSHCACAQNQYMPIKFMAARPHM